MIRNQEKDKALQYNKELIDLFDEQLKFSNAEMILLKDELNWVEYYINVEKHRMQNNFTYQLDIENEEILSFEIPPMILQPLIENSIHHGFNPAYFNGNGLLKSI